MAEIEDPITPALENFDLRIEAPDKPTAVAVREVIGDLIRSVPQPGQEGIETR